MCPPAGGSSAVGQGRLELPTSRLSGVRSNHLSYEPVCTGHFAKTIASQPLKSAVADLIGWATEKGRETKTAARAPFVLRDIKKRREAVDRDVILRKEVIQPQVPLRLPCYDFTPVADLTVAGFLPCGLEHRLQVKPTPMV